MAEPVITREQMGEQIVDLINDWLQGIVDTHQAARSHGITDDELEGSMDEEWDAIAEPLLKLIESQFGKLPQLKVPTL